MNYVIGYFYAFIDLNGYAMKLDDLIGDVHW